MRSTPENIASVAACLLAFMSCSWGLIAARKILHDLDHG